MLGIWARSEISVVTPITKKAVQGVEPVTEITERRNRAPRRGGEASEQLELRRRGLAAGAFELAVPQELLLDVL